jgi:hypothetical protein
MPQSSRLDFVKFLPQPQAPVTPISLEVKRVKFA